jgi:hypothetical protein
MSRIAEGIIEKQFHLVTETAMRYVDLECPIVAEFMEALFGDPTMAMGAPVGDHTRIRTSAPQAVEAVLEICRPPTCDGTRIADSGKF